MPVWSSYTSKKVLEATKELRTQSETWVPEQCWFFFEEVKNRKGILDGNRQLRAYTCQLRCSFQKDNGTQFFFCFFRTRKVLYIGHNSTRRNTQNITMYTISYNFYSFFKRKSCRQDILGQIIDWLREPQKIKRIWSHVWAELARLG